MQALAIAVNGHIKAHARDWAAMQGIRGSKTPEVGLLEILAMMPRLYGLLGRADKCGVRVMGRIRQIKDVPAIYFNVFHFIGRAFIHAVN